MRIWIECKNLFSTHVRIIEYEYRDSFADSKRKLIMRIFDKIVASIIDILIPGMDL